MPDIDRAAEIIYQCLQRGEAIDFVKSNLWPDTVEEGYAIQAALHKHMGGASRAGKLRRQQLLGVPISTSIDR
ncbi:MAG: hypothetical protein ACI8VW_002285 [bacterium]|jgi:2-keto-4-pentenoate hydratase